MRKHKINCNCTLCNIKRGKSIGTNALHYKHGKTHNNKCIDCEVKISFSAKRCKKCYGKTRFLDRHFYCECGVEIKRYDLQCKKCCKINRKNRWMGDKNPNWNNGSSFELYPQKFTNELKEEIRIRDNYTCQKCKITEEEHLTVYGRVLDIHHIDYDKKNCDKGNLITLCQECNIRVNYNRNIWKRYFALKIIKKEKKSNECNSYMERK